MKDSQSLHLKLQEYADCFMDTDHIKELQEVSEKGVAGDATGDVTEVALKYLALAILTGINQKFQKVSLASEGGKKGVCTLVGESQMKLPQPPEGLAKEMVGIIRCVTDIESEKGNSKLIYGLKNDQLEIDVEAARTGEREEVTLTLPKI